MTIVRAACVLLWVCTLPLLSLIRVHTWTSEQALWETAHWWSPQKVRPMAQLGEIGYRTDPVLATNWWTLAVRTYAASDRPRVERAGCRIVLQNLVTVLNQRGQFHDAEEWSVYSCDGPLPSFLSE